MLQFPVKKEIRIFAAYAKVDKVSANKFKWVLQRYSKLEKVFCDEGDFKLGKEWRQEELGRLQTADIILLLVSWSFLISDYCEGELLKEAIERHKRKEARVIPVILHPCPWKDSPLKDLTPLPDEGKPITHCQSWPDALLNIYEGI